VNDYTSHLSQKSRLNYVDNTLMNTMIKQTKKAYDALIIGAGHNGLVAGNYLAKAGKKVLIV
jgi:ribulose 1,5-bisphosphate synthetase/thiazole synthase